LHAIISTGQEVAVGDDLVTRATAEDGIVHVALGQIGADGGVHRYLTVRAALALPVVRRTVFFGGLTLDACAEVLGFTARTTNSSRMSHSWPREV
jgi:hypothetical protein